MKIVLIVFTALLASTEVHAEDIETTTLDSTTNKSALGPYVGARIGLSSFDDACPLGSRCTDNENAWGGIFGYRFNPSWAAEVNFTQYGNYQWVNNGVGSAFSDDISSVNLQGLYYLPIEWPINFYLKGGAAYWKNTAVGKNQNAVLDVDTGYGLSFVGGAGLEYNITEQLVLRGEYEYLFGAGGGSVLDEPTRDIGLFSVGIIYRFGMQPTTSVHNIVQYVDKPVTAIVPVVVPVIVEVPHTQSFVMDEQDGESLFKSGASALIDKTQLDPFIAEIKSKPYTFIQVIGHTDSVGSEKSNQKLSESRAFVIADYLVIKGIEKDKIAVVGKGEIDPLASNSNADGRAKNRRVEIHVKRNMN